jgi:hypothetical protein
MLKLMVVGLGTIIAGSIMVRINSHKFLWIHQYPSLKKDEIFVKGNAIVCS